ncbi:MAG: 2-octaprenyl-6-methoxyphenyl hydroxylase [Lysobacteraceae bacterium]
MIAHPQPFDVLIAGAGLVGGSLACALDRLGLSVALAEAAPLPKANASAAPPGFDDRNLALALATINALQTLGVRPLIDTAPAPIRHIHVSSRGDFGTVQFSAKERGLDRFGETVVARMLGAALESRLAALEHLTQFRPARVAAIETETNRITATLHTPEGERRVAARLLVAADGTDSSLRTLLGIGAQTHDYRQTLFVAVTQADAAPPDTAYERFTPDGPVALLPLSGHRLGSVLTVNHDDAPTITELDDAGYLAVLQERFGWRCGRFLKVGKRSSYPLRKVIAERLIAPRAVLAGNAAQTLHPIGAQGFNLGLRDALTIADVLEETLRRQGDIGGEAMLAEVARRRHVDRTQTLSGSDGLARLFSNTFAPLRLTRAAAMVALGRLPYLSDGIISAAMGFHGETPSLAREASR